MRNIVMTLLTFAGVMSMTAADLTQAQAHDNIQWGVTISSGMPPPPRSQFVWVNGFWYWHGGAYSWVSGHWEPARAGYLYSQPAWHHGTGGWNFQPGRWQHGGHHAYRNNGRHNGHHAGRDRDSGYERGHGHGRDH